MFCCFILSYYRSVSLYCIECITQCWVTFLISFVSRYCTVLLYRTVVLYGTILLYKTVLLFSASLLYSIVIYCAGRTYGKTPHGTTTSEGG